MTTETADIETSSADYARRFAGPAGKYLLQVQSDSVERVLRGCMPGSALDVGGAHAQLVEPLRSRGWTVTVAGSDSECERNLRELHGEWQCKFVAANLLELPFADRSFDLVISVRLVSHAQAWQRLLGELCRVARHWIVIDYPSTSGLNALTPLLFGLKRGFERNTRTYRNFSRDEIESTFEAAGFNRGKAVKQFVLPMVAHRALKSALPLRLFESASRGLGLTALAGSPVILRVDRKK